MEKALESASAAVLITDVNAHIKYANKQFYNLTGYCEQEV
ncbi:PAS domain-containing protein, partial [Vibrio mediterranei]